MPQRKGWRARRAAMQEAKVHTEEASDSAREYLLKDENLYVICNICKMAVREASVAGHEYHEHGLQPPSVRMDPKDPSYTEGLRALRDYLDRREEDGQ